MSMVRTKREDKMENDSKSDNIILGHGLVVEKTTKKTLKFLKTINYQLDMLHIDKVAEKVMIQVIHTLNESGVNIADKEFIRSIGFIDECVKSIIYNDINYEHPLTGLMKFIVDAIKSKNGKVFTSFRIK